MGKMMINHNILGYQMFRQNPYFHFWPQIEEDATQKKKLFYNILYVIQAWSIFWQMW